MHIYPPFPDLVLIDESIDEATSTTQFETDECARCPLRATCASDDLQPEDYDEMRDGPEGAYENELHSDHGD